MKRPNTIIIKKWEIEKTTALQRRTSMYCRNEAFFSFFLLKNICIQDKLMLLLKRNIKEEEKEFYYDF